MSKTIEEILAPKPVARPRLYAYSIDDAAHAGLLKVGQTARPSAGTAARQKRFLRATKHLKIMPMRSSTPTTSKRESVKSSEAICNLT